ncbi:kinase-like domain-containing protein, partial [Pisolithus marmoratus]
VLREVYLWCQLRHKNILPLLGITTTFDKTISIVSPWMGRNAHEYVQDHTIDPRPLILGIAKGLRYLHDRQRPICHGNVNGFNVLISDEGQPLLTGFTLSFNVNSGPESGGDTFETRDWRWIAPEEDVTSEADVWAFGMTAMELFTREKPFYGLRPSAVFSRLALGQPPDRPREECTYSRLTDKWWQICLLCWNSEPPARPTMLQIVEMIVDAENKLLRLGSRYCIDFAWLVERDETRVLHGNYATIYQGTLHPEGRKIAIRTLRRWKEEDGRKLVLREVYLWCRLRHKNILPLLGITTTFDNTISIVSPWMDRNAHQYFTKCELDYFATHPIQILGIAKGLCYLHNHQPPVYHGDVKGTNILISGEGQPLLTGFGLSRLVNSAFDLAVEDPRGGTLQWMAPEYLNTGNVTSEADVWAFGMTALELFTGKVPFHDTRSPVNVIARIVRGQLPDYPSKRSTCSRLTNKWWQICSSCWKPDPPLRPTMLQIVEMIVGAESHAVPSSHARSWLRCF